jgi:hypothetical protein
VNGVNFTRFKFLLVVCFLFAGNAFGQKPEFSIKDLVAFTTVPVNKFDAYISRKGFKPQPDTIVVEDISNGFMKTSKDKSIHKLLGRYDRNDTSTIFFQTNSLQEFDELKADMLETGFIPAVYDSTKRAFPPFYQHSNVLVYPSVKKANETTTYGYRIERKLLPKATDIAFAEDLLSLNAHAYLEAVFGPSNVKKDVFYFSEKEITKCSVLFPNTSLQVIFIWKDEANNRGISFVMIGGQLRTQGSQGFHKAIEMNKWQSSQGIYLGMGLRDLQQLNEGPISFYGWESEQPGIVNPKNKGKLNFRKTGVQLNCLDCNEDKYYSKTGLLNSNDVIQQNGRVYVSTLILMP